MAALHGRHIKPTLRNISIDSRCDVHQTVLGIREGKEGWFDLYCPGGVACDDDGELYSIMVCTEQLFVLIFWQLLLLSIRLLCYSWHMMQRTVLLLCGLSVYLFDTILICAKTAELIKILLGVWTSVSPGNHY